MRSFRPYILFVLSATSTVAWAQYQPYPSSDTGPWPYNEYRESFGNSPLGNRPPASVPGATAYDDGDFIPWEAPHNGGRSGPGGSEFIPRSSPFRPERAASYSPDDEGRYDLPPLQGRLPGDASWGPPPDIHSLAPEGRRSTPPFRGGPPGSVAAQGNVEFQDSPGPYNSGPVVENELFEPNADDLQDDAIWYQPNTWEDYGWETTIELGLNGSSGNARTNSLKAGGKIERETDRNKFLFEIVHNRAATADISIQNNAIGKLRYDRKLGESRWSWFAQGYGEYDEFKDFDLRLVGNTGFNYKFIKTDTTTLGGDFGSGVSHEIGGPDDHYVPEAVFGLDFKHKLSKRQQLYVKTEYFPDWGDFSSYRVVTDAGWELLLDEEWGLNLKIGVLDRYDSTPGTRKANDLNYSMLLLWKL